MAKQEACPADAISVLYAIMSNWMRQATVGPGAA